VKRKIITTADGSNTIHLEEWNEQYHSKHGAIQEAYHVFIKHGLALFSNNVSILEIGFGTGLNAFITFLETVMQNLQINYTGVEAYPVTNKEIALLNYVAQLKANEYASVFKKMHQAEWEVTNTISNNFKLTKKQQFFSDINYNQEFNLVYFDAFGARVQPELWNETMFSLMYKALKPNGILVTYAAKGSVRRAMQAVGFMVERLPGPPGKREMLRAIKSS
jgi:tRNA U34 5-methylaminomethyl-2-thiouridine-forming methyltransferase MnmC